MPIIKEMAESFVSEEFNEYQVFKNGDYIYVLKDECEFSIIEIFVQSDAFETNLVGSLTFFLNEDDVPMIDLATTHPKYRGRGIMTSLYMFMVEHFGILVSDTQVSPAAKRIWDKLGERYNLTEECDEDMPSVTRYVLRCTNANGGL